MAEWGGRKVERLTQLVLSEYGNICHLCMKAIDVEAGEFSVDHVIVRSKGGTDDIENLRPSHKSCNYSRQDRSIEQFRAAHTDNTNWFLALAP